MSQFAAFSPFELPSFEKVKKGRYQRVGCKELGGGGGEGWKEHPGVCACGALECGVSLWEPRASKRFPKSPGSARKNLPLLTKLRAASGGTACPAGWLISDPPKQAFTRSPSAAPSPPLLGGGLVNGLESYFPPPPPPSPGTCFQKTNPKPQILRI